MDKDNNIVPLASNNITFTAKGPAKVIGVGNGDPNCHEHDQGYERNAWNGLAVAIA